VLSSINDDMFEKCLSARVSNGIQPPVDSDINNQRKWDKTVIDAEFNHLLSQYSEPYHMARLLAAAAPHSGDWLHALHISAYNLHLEDNAIRMAVGLRLGSATCEATHSPVALRWTIGQHALSYRKHPGRVQRQAQINDLIHRALIRAEITSF